MRAFLLNISFFTRLPVAKLAPYTDERYRESVKYFPFVGLIIGALSGLPLYVSNHFISLPPAYTAVLSILLYLLISGGIHLDGFADSLDGLLSGRTGERVFEIMKDSRMGAFGTIGLCLYFMVFYTFVQNMSFAAFLMMPYIGKLAATAVAGFSKYPQGKTGMGKIFLDVNTPIKSVLQLLLGSVIAYFAASISALLALWLVVLSAFLSRRWHYRMIGGLSGDSIGFIVESSQLVYLVAYQIIYRLVV
ncbi:adenosylcobinamide-GDP ribazoletransferase [Fusibacter paucivorans]|uniref:Adenosylcobinamide-GDP ribazoletransferase n=1 Tax=Fusibacter paucivorans TaxID=76009 RepID=A0ABS5PSN4_9FIRM|nr:adenosylcobinamide-GDP ribazoletransferase [Fusibacter paucivorans]MBS7527376.1 adenosylcobinamide-GDP ribazoletransferase [Fusibacter paucivorans]